MTKIDKLSMEGIEKIAEKIEGNPEMLRDVTIEYRNQEPLENMLKIHQNSPRGTIYGIAVWTDENIPEGEVHVKYGETILKKFKI